MSCRNRSSLAGLSGFDSRLRWIVTTGGQNIITPTPAILREACHLWTPHLVVRLPSSVLIACAAAFRSPRSPARSSSRQGRATDIVALANVVVLQRDSSQTQPLGLADDFHHHTEFYRKRCGPNA